MDLIFEAIRAVILGAAPVACFTFLVLQWSIANGRLSKFSDHKDLDTQYAEQRKEAKVAKKQAKEDKKAGTAQPNRRRLDKETGVDFLHSKVMFFGGGFYGTMALFTYAIVEIKEIFLFLGKIIDLSSWTLTFSFQFLVDLFINSIMNIVDAFIWFLTLPEYVQVNNYYIWIPAAYIGYMAGVRFTKEYGDQAWERLAQETTNLKNKAFPKN